jgi:UDP-N-acetylglucosamine 4,6-dehydratase
MSFLLYYAMKKKILITGVTGTVAKSFIKEFYDHYEFHGISRNDSSQQILSYDFPKVTCYLGGIDDQKFLYGVFEKVRPDIVVHAAAIKHVDLAEENPIQTCVVNLDGSINVIASSIKYNVPITVGISTDKACSPTNVYGMSKYLMEKCFLSSNGYESKFCCTRFANVAGSTGSVIPKWDDMRKKGIPLTVTDMNMSRLMFSPKEAAELIQKSINLMENGQSAFILTKKMKTVKIYDLAKVLSDQVVVTGIRQGEKLYENLISEKEVSYTELIDNDYVIIRKNQTPEGKRVDGVLNSMTAELMNEEQIKELLNNCGVIL